MKPSISLFFLLFLFNACAKKPNTTQEPVQVPTKEIKESFSKSMDNTDHQNNQNSHYAIHFKFTTKAVSPISAEKILEVLPLQVARSTEIFLAAYSEEQLVAFYDFQNPLSARMIGGTEGGHQEIEEGAATILLPEIFSDQNKASKLDIGIYIVNGYIENFTELVKTKSGVKGIEESLLEKRYRLEGKALAEFLSSY